MNWLNFQLIWSTFKEMAWPYMVKNVLLALLHEKYWRDLHQNFTREPSGAKDELIMFSAYLVNFQGNDKAIYGKKVTFWLICSIVLFICLQFKVVLFWKGYALNFLQCGMTKYGNNWLKGLFCSSDWKFYLILGYFGMYSKPHIIADTVRVLEFNSLLCPNMVKMGFGA